MNSFNEVFEKVFRNNFNSNLSEILVTPKWNPCDTFYFDTEMNIDVIAGNVKTYYRKYKFEFSLSSDSYRNLALWILSVVFHKRNDSFPPYQDEGTESRIILENPLSKIKSIRISADNYSRNCFLDSYHAAHVEYGFIRTDVVRYPLKKYKTEGDSALLPVFMLGHTGKLDPVELIITGTDLSHIVLAELFLNISGAEKPLSEYILESDSGAKNLGYGSADAVLKVRG